MGKDSIIDKIQKLLNLAEGKGTTPAESATAAAHAQRLMEKYRIEQAEIEAAGQAEKEEPEYFKDDPLHQAGRLANWLVTLGGGIARANDCRILVRTGQRYSRSGARITIVGRKSDVAVVRYFFAFAKREIERLAKQAIADGLGFGKGFANSFKMGAASAVGEKLQETKKEEIKYYERGGNSQAIVLLRNRSLDVKRLTNEISSGGKHRGGRSTDYSGHMAGRRAGGNIQFNQGLGRGGRGGKLLTN